MLQAANVQLSQISDQGARIILTLNLYFSLVIVGLVNWDCDFDKSQDECIPSFTFQRIDQNSAWSSGYNFRYTHNYWFPYETAPNGRLETRDVRTQYFNLFSYSKFMELDLFSW
jgi:hypothetical protein